MASRFILHARAGASVAARSVRGRGQILTPSTSYPTLRVDTGSCTGTVPAIQCLRRYGKLSGRQNGALRKVEKRLDTLQKKCDVEPRPSIKDIFKKYKLGHKDAGGVDFTKEFRQITSGVMIVGFSLTLSVLVYLHFS